MEAAEKIERIKKARKTADFIRLKLKIKGQKVNFSGALDAAIQYAYQFATQSDNAIPAVPALSSISYALFVLSCINNGTSHETLRVREYTSKAVVATAGSILPLIEVVKSALGTGITSTDPTLSGAVMIASSTVNTVIDLISYGARLKSTHKELNSNVESINNAYQDLKSRALGDKQADMDRDDSPGVFAAAKAWCKVIEQQGFQSAVEINDVKDGVDSKSSLLLDTKKLLSIKISKTSQQEIDLNNDEIQKAVRSIKKVDSALFLMKHQLKELEDSSPDDSSKSDHAKSIEKLRKSIKVGQTYQIELIKVVEKKKNKNILTLKEEKKRSCRGLGYNCLYKCMNSMVKIVVGALIASAGIVVAVKTSPFTLGSIAICLVSSVIIKAGLYLAKKNGLDEKFAQSSFGKSLIKLKSDISNSLSKHGSKISKFVRAKSKVGKSIIKSTQMWRSSKSRENISNSNPKLDVRNLSTPSNK